VRASHKTKEEKEVDSEQYQNHPRSTPDLTKICATEEKQQAADRNVKGPVKRDRRELRRSLGPVFLDATEREEEHAINMANGCRLRDGRRWEKAEFRKKPEIAEYREGLS